MTNEKAIELLRKISDSQLDGKWGDERREALEMAVRALEGDGDTISRQQAIDAVVRAMIDGADAELVEGIMELLPSAQRWIPCSEWLPDNDVEVFVYLFKHPSPYIAWVTDSHWYTDEFDIEKENEPIAWMPLPKPYRGENDG